MARDVRLCMLEFHMSGFATKQDLARYLFRLNNPCEPESYSGVNPFFPSCPMPGPPIGINGRLSCAGAATKSLKLPVRITTRTLERLVVLEARWPSAQFSSPA